MTDKTRSEADAIAQALSDLRRRITVSLRAFNDAMPQRSWLKRSEIARITRDTLQSAERASRRQPAPVYPVGNLGSRLRRIGAAVFSMRLARSASPGGETTAPAAPSAPPGPKRPPAERMTK